MTIKDIAQLSGYSLGTVSRVLNGHPDVSEKARARVLAVVEEQNFQPNANAKHLKQQASSSIAVFVKGTQNMLFASILEEVQTRLSQSGEDAYICYLDEDANEVASAIQTLRERRPKGLIFLGGDMDFFEKDFSEIHVPSVLLTNSGRNLGFPNLSSFTTDDSEAAARIVDYLVENHHRNIGVLGGSLANTQISYKRIEGFRKRLSDYGIAFDFETQYEPCRYSMADGYEAAKRLLKKNPAVTAVFGLGDVIAFGALRAMADMGRRVPEDISLVGYDGIDAAYYSTPRLATIRQDAKTMADRGVDALLQRIHYAYGPVHEIIPFQLLSGESVREYQK